jgi:mevalonate kinase
MTRPVNQTSATGRAHAKVILIGEHSVVYGRPAIAIPLPTLTAEAVLDLKPDADGIAVGRQILEADPPTCGLTASLNAALARVGLAGRRLRLGVRTNIPPGQGLGSSAAVAVAVARAVLRVRGREPDEGEVEALADISEQYAHGSPSGVDVAAASRDFPIWYVRGRGATVLPVGAPLTLVVATTRQASRTSAAVAHVQRLLAECPTETRRTLDRLGAVADRARTALMAGQLEAVGSAMNRSQELLRALALSTGEAERLVAEARRQGACGAKITGGGLGGSIVALAPTAGAAHQIRTALQAAGAPMIRILQVGVAGATAANRDEGRGGDEAGHSG